MALTMSQVQRTTKTFQRTIMMGIHVETNEGVPAGNFAGLVGVDQFLGLELLQGLRMLIT